MSDSPQKKGLSWPVLLPALAFFVLAGVFAYMLTQNDRDVSALPSALIGKAAPVTPLPPVEGLPLAGLEPESFAGNVTVLNVFASWCAPCREEHPFLMELAGDPRFRLVGLNYRDTAANATDFLAKLGNPYEAIGADTNGRAGIEWGVYGVPETFLVGPDGLIAYKHTGPLTPRIIETQLKPEIEKLLAR